MIKYQDNGTPSIINYNVPEPTAYRGRNLIKLAFDPSKLNNEKGVSVNAENTETNSNRKPSGGSSKNRREILRNQNLNALTKSANSSISKKKELVEVVSVNGSVETKIGLKPEEIPPALYIVETYKLSNFLGDYGAGKVINTFTLLPGEKTKISIKSYKNSSTVSKESSSIFDSYKTEVEDAFETSVQSENTDKSTEEETFGYHVEAEAEASWGVASASVSGGVEGTSNSARETFAKNMESTTNKHANKASAQRDITINSSSETTVNEGEETALERIIENINTDRTLNFVFRQMNQEFISVLHLIDVKIGYYNGYPDTKMEVSIADIDQLLDYSVKDNGDKMKIKEEIFNALTKIVDYKGEVHTDFIVENRDFKFWHVNRKKKTVVDGVKVPIEGIVLMHSKNVMRTDGIIVEALLGQSDAHSPFTSLEKEKNQLLKDASIRSLNLKNELMSLFINGLKESNSELTKNILDYFEKLNGTNEKTE